MVRVRPDLPWVVGGLRWWWVAGSSAGVGGDPPCCGVRLWSVGQSDGLGSPRLSPAMYLSYYGLCQEIKI